MDVLKYAWVQALFTRLGCRVQRKELPQGKMDWRKVERGRRIAWLSFRKNPCEKCTRLTIDELYELEDGFPEFLTRHKKRFEASLDDPNRDDANQFEARLRANA